MKIRLLSYALLVTPLAAVFAQSEPPVTDLIGINNYFTYAAKTKMVLQDTDLPATATLQQLDNHRIVLTLTEWIGTEPRDTVLVGTCTPGGAVKMTYDFGGEAGMKEFLDYVKWHTGCTISGHFPTFYGRFDGTRLLLVTEFNSQCPEHADDNDIFDTPVDGPIHWRWTFDLAVPPPAP